MASLTLKRTGQKMPQIGLGVWKIVYNAIKSGYRLFDGAADYQNEAEAGEGIRRAISEGIVKREDIFVTSKIWNTDHRREHVAQAARHQLGLWGLDSLRRDDFALIEFDLLLVHFPCSLKHTGIPERFASGWYNDEAQTKIELDNVPFQETWEAMEKLVDEGIATNIGVSNMASSLLCDVHRYARIPPQVLQIEVHPYLTQDALVSYAQNVHGLAVTAYSSFAAEGWYEIGASKDIKSLFQQEVIIKIAEKHQKTPAQITLAWATNRGMAVIPKTSNQTRLLENLSVTDIKLSQDEIKAISSLNINLRDRMLTGFCE
ncbi:hypothetical protein Clacol_004162 [Clathrus columnatus]|uniref:NADP-dependent oxidoreductase domain-containing protein n=1 Tax=Clathrus columnatus TaxID=1419009 RepID=A0AAV5A9U1_9AGAM|nr:hypothetical protein Clacol_004162 [Clathrus columnatus]